MNDKENTVIMLPTDILIDLKNVCPDGECDCSNLKTCMEEYFKEQGYSSFIDRLSMY